MDQSLQQSLVPMIASLNKTLTDGVSLAQAQLPDVAHQFLMLNLVDSILGVVGGLILIVFPALLIYKFRNPSKWHMDFFPLYIIGLGIGLFVIAIGLAFVGGYASSIFEIWFAPKAFLIQTLLTLARGGK